MPASGVRLSAGRRQMHEQTQALCFFAGANPIFYGEKLLTTPLPAENQDLAMFARLGLMAVSVLRTDEQLQCLLKATAELTYTLFLSEKECFHVTG